MCGERYRTLPSAGGVGGSSPRVRGTRGRWPGLRRAARFIPACAGNAATSPARWPTSPVHPRVCGERGNGSLLLVPHAGSSPRVRGTRRDGHGAGHRRRFIPACAGNARSAWTGRSRRPVHPRVCGERLHDAGDAAFGGGSSPRVRGTQRVGWWWEAKHRFIPACAGNASSRVMAWPPSAVHPRVCGERAAAPRFDGDEYGSSPRVRGTPVVPPLGLWCRRFIPACAGNASSPASSAGRRPVHPRVCGERGGEFFLRRAEGGSSPRVRGTPYRISSLPPPARFIPACAGNAGRRGTPASSMPVHPRVCGERSRIHALNGSTIGSSPRVRGTLLQQELGTKHVSQCQRAYQMFLLSSDR